MLITDASPQYNGGRRGRDEYLSPDLMPCPLVLGTPPPGASPRAASHSASQMSRNSAGTSGTSHVMISNTPPREPPIVPRGTALYSDVLTGREPIRLLREELREVYGKHNASLLAYDRLNTSLIALTKEYDELAYLNLKTERAKQESNHNLEMKDQDGKIILSEHMFFVMIGVSGLLALIIVVMCIYIQCKKAKWRVKKREILIQKKSLSPQLRSSMMNNKPFKVKPLDHWKSIKITQGSLSTEPTVEKKISNHRSAESSSASSDEIFEGCDTNNQTEQSHV